MTKSQLTAARAELRALTAQLRAAGVTKLAYLEDQIHNYSPSAMRSCLVCARETLNNLAA